MVATARVPPRRLRLGIAIEIARRDEVLHPARPRVEDDDLLLALVEAGTVAVEGVTCGRSDVS